MGNGTQSPSKTKLFLLYGGGHLRKTYHRISYSFVSLRFKYVFEFLSYSLSVSLQADEMQLTQGLQCFFIHPRKGFIS